MSTKHVLLHVFFVLSPLHSQYTLFYSVLRSKNNCVFASNYKFIVYKLWGLVFSVHKTYKHEHVVWWAFSPLCRQFGVESGCQHMVQRDFGRFSNLAFLNHKIHFTEVFFDTGKGNVGIPCFIFLWPACRSLVQDEATHCAVNLYVQVISSYRG